VAVGHGDCERDCEQDERCHVQHTEVSFDKSHIAFFVGVRQKYIKIDARR
jgi:hypothetical protein